MRFGMHVQSRRCIELEIGNGTRNIHLLGQPYGLTIIFRLRLGKTIEAGLIASELLPLLLP